uniref:Uncharacterized protein LOC102808434 n=1 Tax=Saccoglossus kowalevskii TaxID=10224 RepID=A0ABM0LXN1_SACKO|nr:PREDICTED: uncharacterized protein LOC102808434 [Saccoglossus kowalevskii]
MVRPSTPSMHCPYVHHSAGSKARPEAGLWIPEVTVLPRVIVPESRTCTKEKITSLLDFGEALAVVGRNQTTFLTLPIEILRVVIEKAKEKSVVKTCLNMTTNCIYLAENAKSKIYKAVNVLSSTNKNEGDEIEKDNKDHNNITDKKEDAISDGEKIREYEFYNSGDDLFAESTERQWCGSGTDPPGFFFRGRVSANPFGNSMMARLFGVTLAVNINAFLTYDISDEIAALPKHDIIDLIGDILPSIDEMVLLINTFIDIVYENTQSALRELTLELIGIKEDLETIMTGNELFSDLPNIISPVPSRAKKIMYICIDLEQQHADESTRLSSSSVNSLFNYAHQLQSNIERCALLYVENVLKIRKDFTGVGLMFQAKLNIAALDFGSVQIDIVQSNILGECSRFSDMYGLFEDDKSTKGLIKLSHSIKYKRLTLGPNLGGAFALAPNTDEFLFHFFGGVNILRNFDEVNVFITNEIIRFQVDGFIWIVCYASLYAQASVFFLGLNKGGQYEGNLALDTIDCDSGFYQQSIGDLFKCFPCPAGSYQPDIGSATCLPCPDGYTTYEENAVDLGECNLSLLVDGVTTSYTTIDVVDLNESDSAVEAVNVVVIIAVSCSVVMTIVIVAVVLSIVAYCIRKRQKVGIFKPKEIKASHCTTLR